MKPAQPKSAAKPVTETKPGVNFSVPNNDKKHPQQIAQPANAQSQPILAQHIAQPAKAQPIQPYHIAQPAHAQAQPKTPLESKSYQEKQAQEISSLKKQLQEKDITAFENHKNHTKSVQELMKLHAERQKQYLSQIDSERTIHTNELAKIRKLYREGTEKMQKTIDEKEADIKSFAPKLLTIRREAENLQKEKNAESFAKIFKLQMELSTLVKMNKLQVSELQNKMEKRRTSDEQTILDMDVQLKRIERECIFINASGKDGNKVAISTIVSQKPIAVQQNGHVKNQYSMPVVQQQVAASMPSIVETSLLQDELSLSVSDSYDVIQQLKHLAFENESLQDHITSLEDYISDMKLLIDAYIPMRDDVCDKMMANKINSHKLCHYLKNLFSCKGEGLYEFGSKQLLVFLQQNQIKISVKGTNGKVYLEFDEFVNLYTDRELNRPRDSQASQGQASPTRISNSSSVKYHIEPKKKSK